MRVHWQGVIEVAASREAVFAYLADFQRHPEWAVTLDRLELVRPGGVNGVGAQYIAVERLANSEQGWRSRLPRRREARSFCEVSEVRPHSRIAWWAHPIPNVGRADLAFEFSELPNGGTRIVQTIDEHYPPHAAFVLRIAFRLTPERIEQTLDEGLERLRVHLESGHWQRDPG